MLLSEKCQDSDEKSHYACHLLGEKKQRVNIITLLFEKLTWYIPNTCHSVPNKATFLFQQIFACFVALRPKSTTMVMAGR